jgi:hypothetical protein
MTLQHVVLFSYPDELSPDDAAEMRSQVMSWADAIPGIRVLRFGRDLTDARTRGYQYLLYMEFDNEDDMQAYRAHPVHQQFFAWITERNCTPLAFDYHLTNDTVFLPAMPAGAEAEE